MHVNGNYLMHANGNYIAACVFPFHLTLVPESLVSYLYGSYKDLIQL